METQQTNEQLIHALIEEQTKAAKFQVKYNQNDTGKVIAAFNSQCSRLNDSLMQCITAIQSNSLNQPVMQDNRQIAESLHALSLELTHINSSIQSLQIQLNVEDPIAKVAAAEAPVTDVLVAETPATETPIADVPATEESIAEVSAAEAPTIEESITEVAATEAPAAEESTADISSILSEDANKQLSPDEIAALFAALG